MMGTDESQTALCLRPMGLPMAGRGSRSETFLDVKRVTLGEVESEGELHLMCGRDADTNRGRTYSRAEIARF